MHHARPCKKTTTSALLGPKDGSESAQHRPKTAARWPQPSPRRPNETTEAPRCPQEILETPSSLQEAPKEPPGKALRGGHLLVRGCLEGSKRGFRGGGFPGGGPQGLRTPCVGKVPTPLGGKPRTPFLSSHPREAGSGARGRRGLIRDAELARMELSRRPWCRQLARPQLPHQLPAPLSRQLGFCPFRGCIVIHRNSLILNHDLNHGSVIQGALAPLARDSRLHWA